MSQISRKLRDVQGNGFMYWLTGQVVEFPDLPPHLEN